MILSEHKVAVVTCYKQPDYIRAVTLRRAVGALPGAKAIIIKNKRLGLLRYIEVTGRVILVRWRYRPDAYLLTFRGYEMLPLMALLTWPKRLIYDEFINPLAWLGEPRPEKWARYVPQKLLRRFYRLLLGRCQMVLADTDTHADYSAGLSHVSRQKFLAVPVGADETLFKPMRRNQQLPFRVLYYANMLPLHGLEYVLEAALKLRDSPVEFRLIGGGQATNQAVSKAQTAGAQINWAPWVNFELLPEEISRATVCLGGPFGNTPQARQIITGKTYQFMACAAPVIVGITKATTRFSDKQNCLLVPLASAAALAEAVTWAFEHQKQLPAIGQNGRHLYESAFSQKIVAQKLSVIVDELA